MIFIFYFLLIIGLSLNINSGCCPCCKFNPIPSKGTSNTSVISKNKENTDIKDLINKITIIVKKNVLLVNEFTFDKLDEKFSKGIANSQSFNSDVFQINNKDLFDKIFEKTVIITVDFDKSGFDNIGENAYILAAVETQDNCYIVYCDCANFSNNSGFFDTVKNLTRIKILKSGKIKDCKYMFYQCDAKKIDLSGIDTSECSTMERMFEKCSNLYSIDCFPVSSMNSSNLFDIS